MADTPALRTPISHAPTRRAVLRGATAALAAVSTGPFVSTPARAQGFNWTGRRGS